MNYKKDILSQFQPVMYNIFIKYEILRERLSSFSLKMVQKVKRTFLLCIHIHNMKYSIIEEKKGFKLDK